MLITEIQSFFILLLFYIYLKDSTKRISPSINEDLSEPVLPQTPIFNLHLY